MNSSETRRQSARMYALAKILETNGEVHLAQWPKDAAEHLLALADAQDKAGSDQVRTPVASGSPIKSEQSP